MPGWLGIRTIIVLTLILGVAGYILLLRGERDHARAELATFKAQVATAAEKAAELALKKTIADEQRKEAADAEHETTVATLNARIAELRARRTAGSFVPTAASCPERPASACLDRAILERALRDFDAGIQRLVDEGSLAIIDLNSAKRWARGR